MTDPHPILAVRSGAMVDDSGDAIGGVGDTIAREENVKHLEFIQAVITRLASSSFLIKGWTMTIAAAAYGFAVSQFDARFSLVGMIVVLGFWLLDSYYLRQERLFRALYNHVRLDLRGGVPRFSMRTDRFRSYITRCGAFFSPTLITHYGMLTSVGVAIVVLASFSLL